MKHNHDGSKTTCALCGGWQEYAPKLSTKEAYELFGGADFDESEDGLPHPRKQQGGQWGRLNEDEGMTGID